MKRNIAMLLAGLFVGAMLFGSTVQAQGPTTEERLQKLESVVDGDTSTVTARTIRTAASGTRIEMTALDEDRITWYYGGAEVGVMQATMLGAVFGGNLRISKALEIDRTAFLRDELVLSGGVRVVKRGSRLIARFDGRSRVIADFSN